MSKYVNNDEIDLHQIINIIVDSKLFIGSLTSLIAVIAIVYIFVKKPTFEAKAIIKIGEYKIVNSSGLNERVKVDEALALSAELKVLYIDLFEHEKNKITEVKSISTLKKDKNFISIRVHSISNELASQEVKKIVNYIQSKHEKILNEVTEEKEIELKNLLRKIDYVKNTKLIEMKNKIQYQEEIVLNSINDQITLNKNNVKIFKKQLELTEDNLKQIRSKDSTLAAINIMEKRNLEEKINRLHLELITLRKNRENLIKNFIPSLKRNEKNIVESELEMLVEKKKLIEISMLPHNYKNSEIMGKIILDEKPIKPKKVLIIFSSILLGFFIAIICLLLLRSIKKFNEDNK